MRTIKQVSKQTGLTPSYIRKCINHLQTELKPYIHRGKNNAILIDANGVVILDKIKQFREQGLSLPDIQTKLKPGMQNEDKLTQQPIQTLENKGESAMYYVEKLIDAQNLLNEEKDQHLQDVREREEALREKEQEISDLVRKNEALNMSLKMLPGGKSPEEIRSDYEAEQRKKQDIAQIMGELQSASGIFQGKRRQALLEKLHKLLFEM